MNWGINNKSVAKNRTDTKMKERGRDSENITKEVTFKGREE